MKRGFLQARCMNYRLISQQVVEMKKVPTEGLPGCDVCGHIGQDVFFIRSCFRGFLVALWDLTAQFKRHEQK